MNTAPPAEASRAPPCSVMPPLPTLTIPEAGTVSVAPGPMKRFPRLITNPRGRAEVPFVGVCHRKERGAVTSPRPTLSPAVPLEVVPENALDRSAVDEATVTTGSVVGAAPELVKVLFRKSRELT